MSYTTTFSTTGGTDELLAEGHAFVAICVTNDSDTAMKVAVDDDADANTGFTVAAGDHQIFRSLMGRKVTLYCAAASKDGSFREDSGAITSQEFDTAELLVNKDTDATFAANSDDKYPSQKAIKTAFGTASVPVFARLGLGGTPNAQASLDVQSTTKPFLPPRMTTTQKNAVTSPVAGMVVYDSTLGKLCVYTTTWETVTSS